MTAQLLIDGIEDDRARWAEHEACFLPLPVALQGVEAIREHLHVLDDAHILDLGAGAGSIGVALRQVFPAATIVACEPRDEEVSHLLPKYDEVIVGTARQLAALRAGRSARHDFDLVVSNPPWSIWGEVWECAWSMVRPGGYVVMHGPSTWGHSDESSEYIDVFDDCPPLQQWRVRGRVAYNGGAATDNRKVSWWVWRMGAPKGVRGWWSINLPALEAEQRRWRVRPGTEQA